MLAVWISMEWSSIWLQAQTSSFVSSIQISCRQNRIRTLRLVSNSSKLQRRIKRWPHSTPSAQVSLNFTSTITEKCFRSIQGSLWINKLWVPKKPANLIPKQLWHSRLKRCFRKKVCHQRIGKIQPIRLRTLKWAQSNMFKRRMPYTMRSAWSSLT